MSAAVIGRQLRQHQKAEAGRTSGPLAQQAQHKGRPRTPSHLTGIAAHGRPYSPATAPTHYEFYPHPAHREGADRAKNKGEDKKKEEEPKLRCTWHCFCVAMKALSGGIVLLIIGTIMSVVGFFAEPLAVEYVKSDNGTMVPSIDPDTKAHLHNLTYVGPVIMGLGGIVVVAACVLTFEVRDTLGVKVVPVKPEANTTTIAGTSTTTTISTSKPVNSKPLNQRPSLTSDQSGRRQSNKMALPLATISDLKQSMGADKSNQPQCETIQETTFTQEPAPVSVKSNQRNPSKSSVSGVGPFGVIEYHRQQVSKSRRGFSIANQCVTTSPSSGTSHLLSPNIETSYFAIPSPQETELSDPEGCSLVAPAKWKTSRCSCSGSPTRSMSLELYMEDDTPVNVAIVEQQEYLRQQQKIQQYQFQKLQLEKQRSPKHQTKKPKVLASMESDGLFSSSSTSSSDEYLQYSSQKTQQYCRNYVANLNIRSDTLVDQDHCDVTERVANSTISSSVPATRIVRSQLDQTALRPPQDVGQALDKRFPLLRQGALGNGSVANKR